MRKRWRKRYRIRAFFLTKGRKNANGLPNQFTIICNRPQQTKGYIIMEIMSTNVTITTRYRGEFCCKTIYLGRI